MAYTAVTPPAPGQGISATTFGIPVANDLADHETRLLSTGEVGAIQPTSAGPTNITTTETVFDLITINAAAGGIYYGQWEGDVVSSAPPSSYLAGNYFQMRMMVRAGNTFINANIATATQVMSKQYQALAADHTQIMQRGRIVIPSAGQWTFAMTIKRSGGAQDFDVIGDAGNVRLFTIERKIQVP